MKHRSVLVVLLLLASGLRAAAPANSFAVTKAQIDAVLEQHRQPLSFDPVTDNPFRRPGPTLGEQVAVKPAAAAPAPSNNDLIHRLESQLRVSGTLNLAGRLQVIINSTVCEEGHMISVRDGAMIYRLLVAHITPAAVTLQLGDAELVVNIR